LKKFTPKSINNKYNLPICQSKIDENKNGLNLLHKQKISSLKLNSNFELAEPSHSLYNESTCPGQIEDITKNLTSYYISANCVNSQTNLLDKNNKQMLMQVEELELANNNIAASNSLQTTSLSLLTQSVCTRPSREGENKKIHCPGYAEKEYNIQINKILKRKDWNKKDYINNYIKSYTNFLPFNKKNGITLEYKLYKNYFFNNFCLNLPTYSLSASSLFFTAEAVKKLGQTNLLDKNNNSLPANVAANAESREKNATQIENNLKIYTLESTYNLLKIIFKSLYCLISKPIFTISGEKIIIQLFYYLNIPNKSIFKWFSIFFNKKIKKMYNDINNRKTISLIRYYRKKTTCGSRKKYNFSNLYTRFFFGKKGNVLNLGNKYFSFGPGKRIKRSYFNLRKRFFAIRAANNATATQRNNLAASLHTANANRKFILFNLFKNSLNKVYQNKFKIICNILSKFFNKPVELQLTRLHHPYLDSNILVNLLAINLKKKKSNLLINKIFKKKPIKKLNNLPKFNIIQHPNKEYIINNIRPNAFISGLNFYIAGRLMKEPIIPKITTKNFEKGARATGKVNFIDTSSITNKNKKGAFTIKIISGQNFYI